MIRLIVFEQIKKSEKVPKEIRFRHSYSRSLRVPTYNRRATLNKKTKYKHNAELRKTAPAAKVSCHKCSYTTPPKKSGIHKNWLSRKMYAVSSDVVSMFHCIMKKIYKECETLLGFNCSPQLGDYTCLHYCLPMLSDFKDLSLVTSFCNVRAPKSRWRLHHAVSSFFSCWWRHRMFWQTTTVSRWDIFYI